MAESQIGRVWCQGSFEFMDVKGPGSRLRHFCCGRELIKGIDAWRLVIIEPMSVQLRRVIRAHVGADPAAVPLEWTEKCELPGWYPV